MGKVLNDKIVLIGMPGCGKTTIGKILSKELNYKFCDMDEYIEETSQRSIKDIFAESEEVFRELETDACRDLIKRNRLVISTGGGVVKKSRNIEILKNNSVIVFIDRPVENIVGDVEVDSRPLLKDGKEKVYKLYDERYSLYIKAADIIVKNDGFLKDTVNEIIMLLKNKIKE